ncbi:S26 family signal peptidase [Rhizoctonia solani 123E]|uniref:S26 family signal peptidase n=1 Tax=Rhizoctonia solani 123E TaxID=1423351 RepID=A0A074RVJ2_9AGAM|nr:S26 family signal peptidase [Rhizoctonia solani 123E]
MNSFKALFYQRLRGYVFVVTQVTCVAHLFTQHVANVGMCEGASMLPTLNSHGDILLQESLSLKFSSPKLSRGDLVISISPVDPTRLVCKRLLGLPGDTICVDPSENDTRHVVIPQGHVWLQGDNYSNSRDSRVYGPVPVGLVRARVLARVWPLADAKWLRNPWTYLDE